MQKARSLLVLGSLAAEQRESVTVLAGEAGFKADIVEDLHAALDRVETRAPHAVLCDMISPGAEKLCLGVRAKPKLANVPILALGRDMSDLVFAKAFAWGADDVLPFDAGMKLIERLRTLPDLLTLRPPASRGEALIADNDTTRCDLIGRVLMNAGFEVSYAVDERTLRYFATRPTMRVVVASADFGTPRDLIKRARKEGCTAVWIVTAKSHTLDAHTKNTVGLEHVAAINGYAPPENVLFLANELMSGETSQGRVGARVLYGTMVAFRKAGADQDEYGFTYNISATGLYVRTLAPLDADTVWVELCPPRSQRRVRLLGKVIWRRTFGPAASATVPPGFGLQLTNGLGGDHELWIENADAFARMLRPAAGAKPRTASSASIPSIEATLDAFARMPQVEIRISEPPPPPPPAPAAEPVPGTKRPASVVPRPSPSRPKMEAVTPERPKSDRPTTGWTEPGRALPNPDAVQPPLSDSPPPQPAAPALADLLEPPSDPTPEITTPADASVPPPAEDAPASPSAATIPAPATEAEAESPVEAAAPTVAAPRPDPFAATALPIATPFGQGAPPVAWPPPSDPFAAPVSASALARTAYSPTLAEPPIQPAAPVAGGSGTAVRIVLAAIAAMVGIGAGLLAWVVVSRGADLEPTASPPAPVAVTTRPVATPPAATPVAATGAAATTATASAPPVASAAEAVSAAPSAVPPASASAAPSSGTPEPVAAAGLPDVPDDPPGDGSALNWSQGYLIVQSPVSAQTWVTGIDSGRTNTKLLVKCGLRFVRLGELPGPKWLTPGRTVDVKCQSVTRVTITP